jgi:secreted trypsin-like serine protease
MFFHHLTNELQASIVSGGPLMKYYERGNIPHYFLAGLVSYGPKNCGTKDIPGVYTRISKYIEWIQSNLKD